MTVSDAETKFSGWLDELAYVQPILRQALPEAGPRNCYYAVAVAQRLARRRGIRTFAEHVHVMIQLDHVTRVSILGEHAIVKVPRPMGQPRDAWVDVSAGQYPSMPTVPVLVTETKPLSLADHGMTRTYTLLSVDLDVEANYEITTNPEADQNVRRFARSPLCDQLLELVLLSVRHRGVVRVELMPGLAR